MKISYIPVLAVTTPKDSLLEKAISNAIQSTIVEPLCAWCNSMWIKFVDFSFIFCLACAFAGALFGIIGIKKGWKATGFMMIFYLLLRFFSWGMGWY